MMEVKELVWAAGLFEGEGCFGLQTSTSGAHRAIASLASTDQDVVERFFQAVRVGHMAELTNLTITGKRIWSWRSSKYEDTQAVVSMLWYGLGKRRRQRASEVLKLVQVEPLRPKGWNNWDLRKKRYGLSGGNIATGGNNKKAWETRRRLYGPNGRKEKPSLATIS